MDLLADMPAAAKYAAAASLGASALYLLYRSLLPKPLPGIPYNPEATRSLLGDLPSLVREVSRTREFMGWLQGQLDRHDAPVVQIFMIFPFWKPLLIVGDAREVHDIMVRRTPREFDRSTVLAKILIAGVAPDHHIAKRTSDDVWRARRRLLQDLMVPSFLRKTVSPVIYARATEMVQLWEAKMNLADGRPFSAIDDIYNAALDAVLVFSFGEHFTNGSLAATMARIDAMTDEEKAAAVHGVADDQPVKFPAPELHPIIETIKTLSAAIEEVRRSPIKALKWWRLKRTTLKEPIAIKNKFIRNEILFSIDRLQQEGDEWVKSAVDLIVSREARAAAKEGRKPDFLSDGIRDEIFGFTSAGHETTASTLAWAVKLVADNPAAQEKVRAALHEAMPAAFMERRLPTNAELQDCACPYLDALLEETSRCASTIKFNSRDTVQDVEILGHRVPKGTTVWLSQHGQGVLRPSLLRGAAAEDEEKGTKESRDAPSGPMDRGTRRTTGEWDEADMAQFLPDRWINEKGEFDASRGPHLSFGGGIRGCYGKRLAVLELRTILALLFWRFSLETVSEELGGYEAIDGISHRPANCYVKLRPAY